MRHPALSRRGFAAGAALAALLPSAGRAAAPARAESWRAAMERGFALGDGTGLYREYAPGAAEDPRYATEWPFSQVHIAYLDLAMTDAAAVRRYGAALAKVRTAQQLYWSDTSTTGRPGYLARVVPPLGKGDDLYYDDNLWVGLAEVQHHRFSGDAASLRRAKAIFELIRSGWSTDADLPSPGGVRWTQKTDNGDRNTVSNMPAAQLGLRLHQLTGDSRYLEDALRFYRWTNAVLQRPDGLYHDHLKRDGTIEKTVWTYNQGVPVGVNVLLWRATREAQYLREAKRIASAALDRFPLEQLDRQPPPFNAIYFKNLLLLQSVTDEQRPLRGVRAYADHMWRNRRDPVSGLCRPREGRAELIDTAAMVQIEAVLNWAPQDWAKLY
ncbi:glycoside hydrolase family 76 protein [Sphingomonas psychrotolerans]|uniref:Glycoside hydrolase family 76 protein n=1 Tax=Sphingomonas psychrotolerans TaxID=1327635 RepID=A0ABU3N3U0_9SPHN|nr:glycoside hydrolase family 76 protein [Sphingomonas psychrotolerans]MDT8758447.1 glycoside hydrolase family 76 protein [Sphingomonas psychrotolerans]